MLDPVKLPQMAESRTDENFEFRSFLKHHPKLNSAEVDRLALGISERAVFEVWEQLKVATGFRRWRR